MNETLREIREANFVGKLWRHRRADGSIFYADISSNAVTFEGKRARLVLAIDATQRIAVSNALSESRSALAEAQELAHLGSFEIDYVTGDVRWSAELFRILGVDPALEQAHALDEFDHPDDVAAIFAETERARVAHDAFTIEHRIRTRDGKQRYVFRRGRFSYENGEVRRAIGAVLDITEHKQAEERLRHLAERDTLTDLPNRALLHARLLATIERAAAGGTSFAVLFVDLDRFKTINDTMAHAAGDELLRELAARLTKRIGGDAILGRPGGDEFLIILDPLSQEAEGIAVATDLLNAIAEPLEHNGAQLVVTASIGMALFPRDGATPDELLRSADAAMYVAKARGGNAVEVYTAQLHLRAKAELELESDLRGALEHGALEVSFQPIVDATTGTIVSLEALARWSRDGRPVEPADFIPLAEARGLIVRLGTFVLERSCRVIRRLIEAGATQLTMCVNISPWQFRDPDFVDSVRRVLERTGVLPASLQLEITESAFIGAAGDLRNITALESIGIRLSIDDFGTGYSSLSYLKRLPVDSLKIDRSFVSEILTDTADQGIVRAIIAVANILGLSVIAEGVETPEQARYLREVGCTLLQGFYFWRPLPEVEILELFQPQTVLAEHESNSDRS